MNTKHRTGGAGIAAVIAGIISLGTGLDVDAANRPSPDINKRPAPAIVVDGHRPSPDVNKRPKPTVVTMSCPAADDIPQCTLHRGSDAATPDASATALRTPATASGGISGTISPTRMTPSPR
jgi:hypothetical protein